jgi:hypothetical protein
MAIAWVVIKLPAQTMHQANRRRERRVPGIGAAKIDLAKRQAIAIPGNEGENRLEIGLRGRDSMHLKVVTKRGRRACVVKRTKATQRV